MSETTTDATPPPDEAADGKDRHFITAVARAFELLEAFGAGDEALGTQDIAQRTGLPQSTVSRLAKTLTQLGYLAPDPATGRHRLGPGVVALARAFLGARPMARLARAPMEALAERAGAVAALSERADLRMAYVEYARSGAAVVVALGIGDTVPLGSSAAGLAYLASAAPGERAALLDRLAARDPAGRGALEARVSAARGDLAARGYVRAFGLLRPEVNAVGLPLALPADPSRRVALTLAAPAFLADARRMEAEIAPMLLETADAVRRRAIEEGYAP